jgi:hypothetical protein
MVDLALNDSQTNVFWRCAKPEARVKRSILNESVLAWLVVNAPNSVVYCINGSTLKPKAFIAFETAAQAVLFKLTF